MGVEFKLLQYEPSDKLKALLDAGLLWYSAQSGRPPSPCDDHMMYGRQVWTRLISANMPGWRWYIAVED